MAEIRLRNGSTLSILEDTAKINEQKKNKSETFTVHVIKKVELLKIRRSEILTMKDN